MDIYGDVKYTRLNNLKKTVVDITKPADVVQVASEAPPAFLSETQTGSGFQRNAWENFQFDAERASPGADPDPNFFYVASRLDGKC